MAEGYPVFCGVPKVRLEHDTIPVMLQAGKPGGWGARFLCFYALAIRYEAAGLGGAIGGN